MVPSLDQLDRDGGAFAATDADGRDAAGLARRLQGVNKRDDDARARGADRVSQRTGAAMHIDLFMRHAHPRHEGHRDDGEGFVDLHRSTSSRVQSMDFSSFSAAGTGAVGNWPGAWAWLA